MKKALFFYVFVLLSTPLFAQIKIGSGSKVGLTLANFVGSKNDVKFKSDFDAAFDVFANLNEKWSVGVEWDNCTYGTKVGSGNQRSRLNLYNMSIRLNAGYKISKNLLITLGGQWTLNYLGTTVVIDGLSRTKQGEDDFRDFDYGPVIEARYQFADMFYSYLNYYRGFNDVSFQNPDIRQVAYQFGIGAYFGTTYR